MAMIPFEGIEIGGKWLYRPQDKQKVFHNAILHRDTNGYRDFLYGGAAKGGKSHSLRWEAHRNCIQYPKLRGLLIRSSFPELERTHLSLINFDLPHDVMHYNGQYHKATYFNGSTLEFGYGERKEDFKQYLSAEYDFIMIDELTTIPFEFSYLLRSRLAASRSDFIPFWACATNPGDVAHVDVRSYFVKKNMRDAERFPEYNPAEVCFIPATVFDNQILLSRDPGIVQRLRQLSKKDQQKFLFGNWDIFEGQFFDEFFIDVHVVKPENYLTYDQILQFKNIAGLDYGNYSAALFQYKDYNGNVVVYDEWTDIKSVRSVKIASLKKFTEDRGLSRVMIEADTNMWIPDAFDKADKSDPASDFEAAGILLQRVSKNVGRAEMNRGYRVACNDAVRNYLHWEENEAGEMVVKPRLLIYERCTKLIETLPMLMVDDKDQEDIADQGDLDTWYDAFKMGFMSVWQPRAPKAPKEEYKTQAEYVKEEIMRPIINRTIRPRVDADTI